jgi:glycosyltransferase involved in cell wall biosynthesis
MSPPLLAVARRPKRLRLLLCLTSLHPTQGGIASINRNIVRALQSMKGENLDLDVWVLAYHGEAPHLRPEYLEGKPLFQAEGCRSSRWQFARRYAWIGWRWKPDLVFVDHVYLAVVPYLFRRLVASPYVLYCHRIELEQPLSWLRRAGYRGAALRLCNSPFMAGRLPERFPGSAVIPCEPIIDECAMPSSAAEPVASLPDAFGTPRTLGERFVLIVGRLAAGERYKGHDQLIGIMPGLIDQVPDAQLVVAGGGDDADRLKALARDSGKGQAVLFAGFASPGVLATLFTRCRLFAMPSRGEGFGLVYLEAMRFGKPCIASHGDAGEDVVADGRTGLLVDPQNLDELREAVARLLRDEELAERLGRAGLERFNRSYRFPHYRARLRDRLALVLPDIAGTGSAVPLANALVPEAVE